jgi:hypothetical protein
MNVLGMSHHTNCLHFGLSNTTTWVANVKLISQFHSMAFNNSLHGILTRKGCQNDFIICQDTRKEEHFLPLNFNLNHFLIKIFKGLFRNFELKVY